MRHGHHGITLVVPDHLQCHHRRDLPIEVQVATCNHHGVQVRIRQVGHLVGEAGVLIDRHALVVERINDGVVRWTRHHQCVAAEFRRVLIDCTLDHESCVVSAGLFEAGVMNVSSCYLFVKDTAE